MPDQEQWTYNRLAREWQPAVDAPTTPRPTEAPAGTPYGDWPRCAWPNGCTIGVKDKPLCSPHSELVLAYGHAAAPAPDPPAPSAHVERMQRVPDLVNVRSDAGSTPAQLLPMAQVQAALRAGVTEDQVAAHLAAPPAASSPKVRNDARPTSRQAAAKAAPGATTQRGRVLAVIAHAGEDGATDEDVLARTGLALNTVRPRRLELVEQGYVIDSGDTRPTASGAQAIVWMATLEGVQAVASW